MFTENTTGLNMPKSIMFLIVWFGWSAGQGLDFLVRHQIKTDYYIFQNHDLIPVLSVLVIAIFVFDIVTFSSLLKPNYFGFYAAIASLVLGLVQNIMSLSLALPDLPGVREAYEVGREIRGLPVREKTMDAIFSQQGMYYSLALMVAFYILVFYYVLKNRNYFYGDNLSA